VRVLAGVVFSIGLILVVVGGAELFTGNTLIVMARASGRVGTGALLRSWLIVYAGNFVGAGSVAAGVFVARSHEFGPGAFGVTARWASWSPRSIQASSQRRASPRRPRHSPGGASWSATCCRSRSATSSGAPHSWAASTGSSTCAPPDAPRSADGDRRRRSAPEPQLRATCPSWP